MPIVDRSVANNAQLLSPLAMVRGFPLLTLLLAALAMVFSKHENILTLCLGGAVGLLIGYTAFCFSIKSVTLKQIEQPSDVRRYPLT